MKDTDYRPGYYYVYVLVYLDGTAKEGEPCEDPAEADQLGQWALADDEQAAGYRLEVRRCR